MKGINKFMEKKGFKTAVCVVNVCLIFGLIFYLILVYVERNGLVNSESALSVEGKEYMEVDAANAMDAAADQMVSVYYTLLQGSHADIGDDKNLQFGIDGNFSGFFDMEHPDVSGYTYEVLGLSESEEDNAGYEANVNIYNPDKSAYVQYKLLFDDNLNMQLYYQDSKTYIPLSF